MPESSLPKTVAPASQVKQFLAIKASSYAVMLKKFEEQKLLSRVKTNDKEQTQFISEKAQTHFIEMVIQESRVASLAADVKKDPYLSTLSSRIASNLDYLMRNTHREDQEAVKTYHYFNNEYSAIKNQLLEKEKERQEITEKMNTFIGRKDSLFDEVIKKIKAGRPQKEIELLTQQVAAKQIELRKETNKLIEDENVIRSQLMKLQTDTSQFSREAKVEITPAPHIAPPTGS